MCTLILLDRVVSAFPLVVAANRDEYYSRPAGPPARSIPTEPGRPAFVAPQDLEAGGTWMGLNASGLFVGLTNRPTGEISRERRSRGLLVQDALAMRSAAEVAENMKDARDALEASYNPFHLLYADGRRSFLTWLDERGGQTRELEPGAHVICNRDESDPASRKVARIRRSVEQIDVTSPLDKIIAALADVLGSHGDENPLENACVHTPKYGTRSSSLIAAGETRKKYLFADGSPCETKYQNYTRLLDPAPVGIDQSR